MIGGAEAERDGKGNFFFFFKWVGTRATAVT